MRPVPNVLWNLFLAIVPVVLAFVIARGVRRERQATGYVQWLLWGPLIFIWLLFLPNSCYLLTEWRHYLETLTQSRLYAEAHHGGDGRMDFFLITGFYLVYSGAGLLAFFLAVWPLDRLTRPRLGWRGAMLRPLIFPLCALGVYLGLMRGRFNSWDLVSAPRLAGLLSTAAQVFHRPFLLGLIAVFGAVLWLFYAAFDLLMDGLAWRLSRRHARRAADPRRIIHGERFNSCFCVTLPPAAACSAACLSPSCWPFTSALSASTSLSPKPCPTRSTRA